MIRDILFTPQITSTLVMAKVRPGKLIMLNAFSEVSCERKQAGCCRTFEYCKVQTNVVKLNPF